LPIAAVLCAACLAGLIVSGCDKSIPVAEVDGLLPVHGKPGSKMRIEFIPDIDKGTNGPPSMADTDSAGHFTLELKERNSTAPRPGAVIGCHRVVLSDLQLAESATGQGVPIRVAREYTLPGSTPVRQEVRDGNQTIEIRIP
jgi:hypothetical protein